MVLKASCINIKCWQFLKTLEGLFPSLYVPKKIDEKRLVTIFQNLNKAAVADSCTLPNVTTLLESLGNSAYPSSLYLLKGFNQIACDQETIPKLQISTPFGAYCYTVMPFRVLNGPSTFSWTINLALGDFNFCTAYIDDNQVFSKSYEKNLDHRMYPKGTLRF